jgi:uncharacterized delta-60 repeat protein
MNTQTTLTARIHATAARRLFRRAALLVLGTLCMVAPAGAVEENLVYVEHNFEKRDAGSGQGSSFAAAARQSTGRRIAVGYGTTNPLPSASPLMRGNPHRNFLVAGFDTRAAADADFADCVPGIGVFCPPNGTTRINIRSGVNVLGGTVKSHDEATDVAVDAEDRIVVVGNSELFGATRGAIVRLAPDGRLDRTFGENGIAIVGAPGGEDTFLSAVAIQDDGKIVAAGWYKTGGPNLDDFFVTRLLANGDPDPIFTQGVIGTSMFGFEEEGFASSDHATAIALRPADRILVVGTSSYMRYDGVARQTSDLAIAQLRTNGGFDDVRFINGGRIREDFALWPAEPYSTRDIALDAIYLSNGSFIVVGEVSREHEGTNALIAKFHGNGRFSRSVTLDVTPEVPGAISSRATGIDVTPDNDLVVSVVTGGIKESPANLDFLAYRFNRDLELLDAYVVAESAPYASSANSILALDDSRFVLVGSAWDPADRRTDTATWQPSYSECGNGILEGDEQCEAPFGGCCDRNCRFSSPKASCRVTLGECELDSFCTGESTVCPQIQFADEGTLCGDPNADECSAPDICDGIGRCIDNDLPEGIRCGGPGDECALSDVCDGNGSCVDNGFEPAGTACGDQGADGCNAADTCDGEGGCEGNFAPAGAACGDGSDTECSQPDGCDGDGSCLDNHEDRGTGCGDPGNECVLADFCDGDGDCRDPGDAPANTPAPNLCNDGSSCTADLCNGAGGCDNSQATPEFDVDVDGNGVNDNDGDGIFDACDTCMDLCNADQLDTDGDCPDLPNGALCGDACDACPAIDQANQHERCDDLAALDENAALACCIPEGSVAVAVDEFGGQCEMPDDVEVTSPDGQVTILIPQGAVDGDTTIAATRTTKGGHQETLRGANRYVTAATFSPPGAEFDPALVIVFRWQDEENLEVPEAALDVMAPGNRPGRGWMCHKGDGWTDRTDTAFRVAERNLRLVHREDAEDEDEERGVFSPRCGEAACGAIGEDGWPSDWGGHHRTDNEDLRFCCDLCRNQVFFETDHFSEYAIGETTCAASQRPLLSASLSEQEGRDGLRIKGAFSLEEAGIQRFAPDENGMSITISTARGETVLHHVLAGSLAEEGQQGRWRANRRRTSLRFAGRASDWKVGLRERRGTVRYSLRGDHLKLPELGLEDLPLQVELRFTSDSAPVLEQDCTELRFDSQRSSCSMNQSGTAVVCR